ncbi:hypothetical protein [Syntrophomonas palmitatica]|nr:hypothetical protein [Syntrophomonas palmitatica]
MNNETNRHEKNERLKFEISQEMGIILPNNNEEANEKNNKK